MGVSSLLNFFWVFLPCFSMLIMPLPLSGLVCKSTCLRAGFCVCRSRQYDRICWELDLICGFLDFSWLIVWLDVINECGWCLAGGRRVFWLKSLFRVPALLYTSLISRLYVSFQLANLLSIFIKQFTVIN